MTDSMSPADVLALSNSNDGFGGTGGWLWFLIVMFAIWGGGFGGVNGQQYSTSAEVQRGFDNQNIMQRFDTLAQNQSMNAYDNAALIAQNRYDNAQLINQSNINNMQSTFNLQNGINTGFDSVNANINNLAHQMEQCCCSLKTQMLQDKYDAAQNQLNLAEMASVAANQTQTILGNMGKWYANAPIYQYPYYYGTTTV